MFGWPLRKLPLAVIPAWMSDSALAAKYAKETQGPFYGEVRLSPLSSGDGWARVAAVLASCQPLGLPVILESGVWTFGANTQLVLSAVDGSGYRVLPATAGAFTLTVPMVVSTLTSLPSPVSFPGGVVEFDFRSDPGALGYLLPPWMSYTCNTAGRTLPINANGTALPVRSGIAANVPAARSRDGTTFGLPLLKATTNLYSNPFAWGGTGWHAPSGMVAVGTYLGPDGGAATAHEFTSSGNAQVSAYQTVVTPANVTVSAWAKLISAGSPAIGEFASLEAVPVQALYPAPTGAGWSLYSLFSSVSLPDFYFSQYGSGSLDFAAYGIQAEASLYATPIVSGTRAVTLFNMLSGVIAPTGRWSLRAKFRVHYAQNQTSVDHNWFCPDLLNRFYYCQADHKFKYLVAGTALETPACTFPAEEVIDLKWWSTSSGKGFRIDSSTLGQIQMTGAAECAATLPASIPIGGAAAGCEECVDLLYFRAEYAP